MKKHLSLLLLFLLVLGFSCDITEPTEGDQTPGRRDYEWKIDTLNLNAPFNHYTKIWGSEPNNIWIVGSAGDFDKTILRYDGEKISNYGRLPINPKTVFGLSSNEIWFAGSEFDFWKYDGNIISKFSVHILDNYYNSFIVDIWGNVKSNIYAVGSATVASTGRINAVIVNYNGIKWAYSLTPIPDLHFVKIRKGQTDNKYYLLGVKIKPGEPDSYGFYEFNGANIQLFNLSEGSKTISKNITLLGSYLYFYIDKEIYKMVSNKIQYFASLKNTNVNGTQIWGRNERDFFIQTSDGIGHYNGNNLETLFQIKGDFGIFDGLTFDSDVYFIGFYRDSFKFFLIHGR